MTTISELASLLAAGVVALALASPALAQGAAPPDAQAAATPQGDAAHGRQVFDAVGCWQCHGYVGQGSILSGPRLAPKPLPLDKFRELVREPLNQMPAYSTEVLSDEDLTDVHAYLESIPAPPAVKDIPLLSQGG
jgi:ubiquinol-cytochrome c reductase cytochrome c subunit